MLHKENMETIKDYLPGKRPDEIKVEKKEKKTYDTEIVVSSEPDFVIRKKMKTPKLLVMLVSQNQFYIKEEKSGKVIEFPTIDDIGNFLNNISEPLPTGCYWLSELPTTKKALYRLIEILRENENLRYVIKHGYIKLNHNVLMKKSELRLDFNRPLLELLNSNAGRVFAEETNKYINRSLFCESIGSSVSGATYKTGAKNRYETKFRIAVDYAKSMQELHSLIGQDGFRKFYRKWMEYRPAMTFPSLDSIRTVLLKTADPTDYRVKNRFAKTVDVFDEIETEIREFDQQAFCEYGILKACVQGYGDNMSAFFYNWGTYLRLQEVVYGKVKDKYPEYLDSALFILWSKFNEAAELWEKKSFDESVRKAQKRNWNPSGRQFFIRAPESRTDMIDEATEQSNCLSGYIAEFAEGATDIYFMRHVSVPDKSFIMIEVRNNRLTQARAKSNYAPEKDCMDFIYDWCEQFGIDYGKAA